MQWPGKPKASSLRLSSLVVTASRGRLSFSGGTSCDCPASPQPTPSLPLLLALPLEGDVRVFSGGHYLAHPLYSIRLLSDMPPLCYLPGSCCTTRLFSPFPHFAHSLGHSITTPRRETIVPCSPILRHPNMSPCSSRCSMHLIVCTPTESSGLRALHTHCEPPHFQLLYMIFQPLNIQFHSLDTHSHFQPLGAAVSIQNRCLNTIVPQPLHLS